MERSGRGNDYSETDGSFATKIETTSAFQTWRLTPSITSFAFTRSDNADLFFALNKVNIAMGGNSTGARAVITDTFDFRFELNLQDLFTTLVNDWAYLCQQTYVLNPIDVTIIITL